MGTEAHGASAPTRAELKLNPVLRLCHPATVGNWLMVQLYRTLPGDGCCGFGCQEWFCPGPEASPDPCSESLFQELDLLCCKSQMMQGKVVTCQWVTLRVTALYLNVTTAQQVSALCIHFLLSLVKLEANQWELCLKQGKEGLSKVIWDFRLGCFLNGPFCSKFHLGRDYESLPRNPLPFDTH